MPFEDYPQSMHVAGHSICKNCMKKYIGTKILRQGDLKIQCPSDDCAIILQYDEIREYGSNAAFRLSYCKLFHLLVGTTNSSAEGHMRKIPISDGAPIDHAQWDKLSRTEVLIPSSKSLTTYRNLYLFRLSGL